MTTTDLPSLDGARRGPAYGAVVWAWGLWAGLTLWAAGFFFLPWWAALALWWWPSMLVGGGVGLFAVWLANLWSRRRRGLAEHPSQCSEMG